jgi:hypothetical protein
VTTKPERCCVRRSPAPVTCRSTATSCTSGSTPPRRHDAARPSPLFVPSLATPRPLPRQRSDPRLQPQRPPGDCTKDLTLSGVLDPPPVMLQAGEDPPRPRDRRSGHRRYEERPARSPTLRLVFSQQCELVFNSRSTTPDRMRGRGMRRCNRWKSQGWKDIR